MDFNKQKLNEIKESLGYLQDEMEALKYMAGTMAFDKAPEGQSEAIVDLIALIDHAQVSYFRPAIEGITRNSPKRTFEIEVDFRDTFNIKFEDEYGSVDKLLNKVIKHRAALLSVVNRIPPIEWERKGVIKGKSRSVFQILTELVHFEKKQLKLIADRVKSGG